MKQARVLVLAGAVVAVVGFHRPASGQSVQACPTASNCVHVGVTPASQPGTPGSTVHVGLTFNQAPSDGQSGGPDEIAALALTLALGDGTAVPLTLADCNLDADGLPAAVHPDASISNFKVVVENASCANGRTHCLCPDAGSFIVPDPFVNLVVYGPNPLPTPGLNPIDIPTLPPGPQELMTIDLKVAADATLPIRIHPYNQAAEPQRPQFTAFLSVGDKLAVDQTCVAIAGEPPCSGPQATSQVVVTDAVVGEACVGDCNGDGEVTVNEIIVMVNVALGTNNVSACPAGDADGNQAIEITEIIAAVNNALNGCS